MPVRRPAVTFVGTIHLYEEARPRLEAILNELAPRVITVEISRFSIDFRQRYRRIWEERFNLAVMRLGLDCHSSPVLELLKRQISMPYEWEVARDFGAKNGARAVPVDISTLSKKDLPLWEKELLCEENIKCGLQNSKGKSLKEHFEAIRRQAIPLLKGCHSDTPRPLHPLAWLEDPFWEGRERILFHRIMRILRVAGEVVHICGWMHCIMGSPWCTLADHLVAAGQRVRIVPAF